MRGSRGEMVTSASVGHSPAEVQTAALSATHLKGITFLWESVQTQDRAPSLAVLTVCCLVLFPCTGDRGTVVSPHVRCLRPCSAHSRAGGLQWVHRRSSFTGAVFSSFFSPAPWGLAPFGESRCETAGEREMSGCVPVKRGQRGDLFSL